MVKSKSLVYILWLFGGIFGLHHIYLGRDKQAFLWFTTLGCFFLGYLRDFFRLNDYIDEANQSEAYESRLAKRMSRLKVPSFESIRFFGSIFIALIYGNLVKYSMPIEYDELLFRLFYAFLWPLGCAIGAYLVNTEGHRKCNFRWALIGAYGSLFFMNNTLFGAVICTFVVNWKTEWRYPLKDSKHKKSLKKRLFALFICASIYVPITVSYLLNNSSITINGEETKLIDAIRNFLNSKAWRDLKAFSLRLWHIYRLHGFERLKNEFLHGLDTQGVSHAYEILGLSERASQDEVNIKCRTLSRQWHPDRYKDETQKQLAQEKFMNIQEACNKISSKKRDKFNKNTRDHETGGRTEF